MNFCYALLLFSVMRTTTQQRCDIVLKRKCRSQNLISVIDFHVTIKNSSILCENQNCGECALSILEIMESNDQTYQDFLTEYQELDKDFGSASKNRSLSKLSCHPTGIPFPKKKSGKNRDRIKNPDPESGILVQQAKIVL